VRVLITGAAGQLGHDCRLVCEKAGDEVSALDRASLDVTDRDAVMGAMHAFRPHAVLNCATWTAVDACESDPAKAFVTNALAARWMAEACRRTDAHLVHVSTDYVFDGSKPEPYHEWDVTNPASVYGASKAAGEREVLGAGIGATVARTSWLCGQYGANMVKTILKFAAERPTLTFVDDQRGHPTFTADLAPMLRRLAVDRRPGMHHVTNAGAVSWFEFARAVVAASGRDADMVLPCATADLQPPRPAPRPANSVLDNAVLRASGLPMLRDFHEPLGELVAALVAN
jgi:dTDP-4-dehydrorhamnose reductase